MIEERDLPKVVDCLMRGFPERPRAFWTDGLARLAARPPVGDLPRFGHLLAAGETVVGVAAADRLDARDRRRPLRPAATWRAGASTRTIAATAIRCTPARSVGAKSSISPSRPRRTRCRRSRRSAIAAIPRARSSSRRCCRAARSARASSTYAPDRPEAALLVRQATRACSPTTPRSAATPSSASCGNEARPLVFQPRKIWRELIPCVHLVYCREPSDLARFGPAYGRRSPATAASSSSPTPSAPFPASPGAISPSASRVTTRVRAPLALRPRRHRTGDLRAIRAGRRGARSRRRET